MAGVCGSFVEVLETLGATGLTTVEAVPDAERASIIADVWVARAALIAASPAALKM